MEKVTWNRVLLQISLFVNLALIGCYGNQISYKHLPHSETEIKVDKIITLDTAVTRERSKVSKGDTKLLELVEQLKLEISELKEYRKTDRQRLHNMEKRLENYHEEIIVSIAEVVQLRQLLSESYDKTKQLEDMAKDFNLLSQNFPYFEKEVRKELRRNSEYKERAAKRFHQVEKGVKKLESAGETTLRTVSNLTQEFENLHDNLSYIRNLTHDLQENLTESWNVTSQCCNQSHISLNGLSQSDILKLLHSKLGENKGAYSKLPTKDIEITEFGSGELYEYALPLPELDKPAGLTESQENSPLDQIEHGSGEIRETTHISDGSGESEHEGSSGDAIELPPFFDINKFVERDVFLTEISIREQRFLELGKKFTNLTEYVEELETRLTSIQLGNFMQSLQESFINFTQNVLTIDQFKMTSSQIVNSTLMNQDSIVKLTNMILENTDKIADLRWKFSNSELLSDQQFNILRMYVIRMNNSIEDIKDDMKKLETRKPPMNGHQSGYYYHPGYGAQFPGYQTGDKTQGTSQNMETLSSRLDHIGLQIIYNQNRIGNLEVKFLNESLYTCRKYNMDSYQDSQLAAQEGMIKANLNSILLNHELLKKLDDAVNTIEHGLRSNSRKMRFVMQNLDRFRDVLPLMVHMKQEVDHFMFQLPSDCSEYYQRGYRKSGVYVIHPITAKKSSQVTCHMTQDGGWTVFQQRFDGSLSFNKNWTAYRQGFGEAESEYWLGSDIVYMISSRNKYSLMIEMVDIYDIKWVATYDKFSVSHPDDKFALGVSSYHGNATDNMKYSDGFAFSTPDRDNDASGTNCAYFYDSGWWFKHCQLCNLNGRYDIGFMWFNLNTSSWIRLKSSVMKIKPFNTK